jgi:hypothetical protein
LVIGLISAKAKVSGPVYHRGWVKFIEFDPSLVDEP